MPKLDEIPEENNTKTGSDASYHTRDAEITDETMVSSSSNSPDTTVPETEVEAAGNVEENTQTEQHTGGTIQRTRRSCRMSKEVDKLGGVN